MFLLLAPKSQVDEATLRQRETNPEHQEAELREALHGAVGTDSRDGAWEKFKLEALADGGSAARRRRIKTRSSRASRGACCSSRRTGTRIV